MSSTGRSDVRVEQDYYPTPAWCVRRLLEAVPLPPGDWLEPCAGDGAIIRAVDSFWSASRSTRRWYANDIRPECGPALAKASNFWFSTDFLNAGEFTAARGGWSVIITNPPYSLAREFVEKSLRIANCVAMLLRLNFLGSGDRASLFRTFPPDVYVLPNRPSFVNGRTDSTEYAWFVWPPERNRTHGHLQVLALTPKEERATKMVVLEEKLGPSIDEVLS